MYRILSPIVHDRANMCVSCPYGITLTCYYVSTDFSSVLEFWVLFSKMHVHLTDPVDTIRTVTGDYL